MLTIYKASAGSGKTYNLALSYIRHLLGYHSKDDARIRPYKGAAAHNHRSILAITFTNAATEEMKTRIIKRLAQLADDPASSDYIAHLTEVFGVDAQVIQQAARHALSELLYDYSNFYVSTIDSFFQTVLRTFAREVDQQGDFELSLEQKSIVPEVISLMLEELNRTPGYQSEPLYKWIMSQAINQTEDGKAPNYFDREGSLLGALADNVNKSMEEVYHSYGSELDDYLTDPTRPARFTEEIEKRLNGIYDDIRKKAVVLDRIISTGKFDSLKPVFLRLVKCGLKPRSIQLKDIQAATPRNIVADPVPGMADKGAKFRKLLDSSTVEHLAALAADYCSFLIDSVPTIELYNLLLNGAIHLQFIALFRRELAKYLRENNTLLIADTGELLKRIISDQEIPFIYERLGMRLESLLIDEFQDTSKLQWQNLRPLVTNSIAQGESLIIGDVKQSIYRFRNSDSSLLDHQVQSDPAISPFVVHRGTAKADNTNRRSAPDIVRFNNTFFHYVAKQLGMDSYNGVIQELDPKNSEPANITVVVEKSPESGCTPRKDLKQSWRLTTLAENILDQHSRGYRWKDIAILVNTHEQAREVVSFCLDNYPNIRLLSNEALLLSNSPAVRTVMSVLELVARDIVERPRVKKSDPDDPDEAPGVTFHNKADLTTLLTRFNYHRSKGLTYQDALQKALEQVEARETGSLEARVRRIREKKSTNLVTLLENIIAEEISEDDRKSQIAFLAALQDRATAHCLGPDPSVAAFLRAYDLNISRWAIKAPSSLDAVKIMTIHASKGLEWPCVHVPYASWKMFKGGQRWFVLKNGLPAQGGLFNTPFNPDIVPPILRLKVDSDGVLYSAPSFSADTTANKKAEELDNLNKLYVAFTRAGRELNVLFTHAPIVTKDSTYSNALAFFEKFSGKPTSDPRLIGIDTSTEPADDSHGPLLIYRHCTGGTPANYTPRADRKADADAEVELTEPYVAIPRPDLGKLIAIEDLSMVDDMSIGIEQPKEIADTLDAVAETVSAATQRAAVRGMDLHSVLAEMTTLDDLDRALRRLKVRQNLPDSTAEQYRTILEDAFAKAPAAKEWFHAENTVWNEQSFFDPEAGEHNEGLVLRPDRIVQRPDGSLIVVDYKFVSAPDEERRREYREQVGRYVDLLRRMGHENVSGYLWYPRRHRIEKVNAKL